MVRVDPPHVWNQRVVVLTQRNCTAKVGTTHWPNALHSGTNIAKRNGQPDSIVRTEPLNPPVLSERAFKLTGIPYIKV